MGRAFNHLAIFVLITLLFNILYHIVADDRKVYIVYMGSLPKDGIYSPLGHHQNILEEVLESSLPSDCLVRSYTRSFNGFAAKLTEKEKQKLAGMEGIVSVFPSETYELHTTRSWDFMGLMEDVKRVPEVESNVIVGMLDTGVWPEAESFNDRGFGPPPLKWKGACKGGKNFTCNKKLIGARFYSKLPMHISSRDTVGHGTHTASIAAGIQVNNVSFYGLGKGNARGAVPSARIAVYTVCWKDFGCLGDAILAAFDDAISDGVDIISVSLGSRGAIHYFNDSIAIGSFHAMQHGILTSQSAGNNGPHQSTVASVAPWILTVAASSTDRKIMSKVVLGDNSTLVGRAVNSFDMKKKIPLINGSLNYESSSSSFCNKHNIRWCDDNRLRNDSYKGKIIFYDTFTRGKPALDKKAAGMIVQSSDFQDFSWSYPLPASLLSIPDAEKVVSYINNTKDPVANILKSEVFDDPRAPVVVSFSSRGPNSITQDILKPDITAPGVEILSAWSPEYSPSDFPEDKRSTMYNILSGTSMSCPHATGAAAYVKAFHPDWSPSAIKSALMTTALALNSTENQDAEFSYGAGQIDPVKAVNPGLVYDAADRDYIHFLCSIGYTEKQMKLISGSESSCPRNFSGSPNEFNYPSIVSVTSDANFSRTVMNVGEANSTYKATVSAPSNINITVTPDVLTFKSSEEKQSFNVKITATSLEENHIYSASLVWSDGVHIVRSPIVVHLKSNWSRVRSVTPYD